MVRYFGQSPDYWEDWLTIPRYSTYRDHLRREPPADWFLAGYFKYQPANTSLPEIPEVESSLPDVEE